MGGYLKDRNCGQINPCEFDDIGSHGTKVIIYNLWCNDDGNLELDFDTDPTDIRLAGDVKQIDTRKAWKSVNEEHVANRFRYSLHVYMSILYLKIPESFQIILRGQVVRPHNIADDLKYPQFVKYQPLVGGSVKGTALTVTTIGFLKEAPQVNIHGFNIYHKNRLILVVSYLDSRGRGVVGILQADFIEPTHNKQDFERTSLFQKLEGRLKEMTWEYWDTHCTLFGYKDKDKKRLPPKVTSMQKPLSKEKPVMLNRSCSPVFNTKAEYGNSERCYAKLPISSEQGSHKRKTHELIDLENIEKHARIENITCVGRNQNKQIIATPADQVQVCDRKTMHLMQQNKKLHAKCIEFEKSGEELNLKVKTLKSKIQEAQDEYKRLLAEVKSLDLIDE